MEWMMLLELADLLIESDPLSHRHSPFRHIRDCAQCEFEKKLYFLRLSEVDRKISDLINAAIAKNRAMKGTMAGISPTGLALNDAIESLTNVKS